MPGEMQPRSPKTPTKPEVEKQVQDIYTFESVVSQRLQRLHFLKKACMTLLWALRLGNAVALLNLLHSWYNQEAYLLQPYQSFMPLVCSLSLSMLYYVLGLHKACSMEDEYLKSCNLYLRYFGVFFSKETGKLYGIYASSVDPK